MKINGIYQIQSIIKPKRIYIGSAVNIKGRWSSHLSELRKNKHGNGKLQNHYNKYGESDLIFIIVELCFPEFLTAREQFYINKLKPWFNICKIAGNTLGVKYSNEACKNMSESQKGKTLSEKTRQKMSIAAKNRPSISEETRRKMSESLKGKGMFGKHLSDEHKRKISESLMGHKNYYTSKKKIMETKIVEVK